MRALQEKSRCCYSKVRRFGKRRRQCTSCKKTWRVWSKKRGRKFLRYDSFKPLVDYLSNSTGPLGKEARKRNINEAAFRNRIRILLKKYISQTPWATIPSGQLIVLVDALMQIVKGETWTVYIILLRGIDSESAAITSPYLLKGSEGGIGWRLAFNRLSEDVQGRIIALVCDGKSQLVFFARHKGWILQRCHFHLRYRIANYARTGILNRNLGVAEKIKALIDTILFDPDEDSVQEALRTLGIFTPRLNSYGLRFVLRGFLKNYLDFRTYLIFPKLHLPTTTNSVESLNGKFRDLQRRARGFRTIKAFYLWIVALCKHQKTITCNGNKFQPN